MTETAVRNKEPTQASSVVAVVLAVSATGLSVATPSQVLPIGVEAFGLLVFLIGKTVRQHNYRIIGSGLVFLGMSIVWLSLGLVAVFPIGLLMRATLCLGMVGTAILTVGLAPLRIAWTRQLLSIGVGILIISIIGIGIVKKTVHFRLIGAMTTAVMAWDAGEQAISLGEHVGRSADTVTVEIIHLLGSGAIGATAITLSILIYGTTASEIPFVSLALLLCGTIVLLLALML